MTPAAADPRVEALITQLRYTSYALAINVADMSHEDSLVQPQPAGNCLNWIVGHLVASRNGILAMLGKEPTWDHEMAPRYARSTDPIDEAVEGVIPLDELVAAFDAAQREIVDGLKAISSEQLEELVPWFGEDVPKAVALAGLVFHEAYHVGQTGLLRRIAGKPGAIQ